MIQSFGTRVALACLVQLLLLMTMYGTYSPTIGAIHKALFLTASIALAVFAYQAFRRQRIMLGLAAALAAFPGLAFWLLILRAAFSQL
jgi:hypothetical protein